MIGRRPAKPVRLPPIEDEAEAIADWLWEREGAVKRPEQAARILALAVKLHLRGGLPWPVRRQVKDHTGVSLPMIDAVLSQRQRSGDIAIETKTIPGNIAKHASVITQKFIRPSTELIAVASLPPLLKAGP